MKKEYNFKGAVQGKFHRPKKIQKTLQLDADVLSFYINLGEAEGIPSK